MNIHATPGAGRGEEDGVSRRQTIVEILSERRISSQAELARLLQRRGFHATQATLSRDLKSLGVGKVPVDGKTYYMLPLPPREVLDVHRQRLEIEAFVQEVKPVQNLVIVRTPPGNAHGVARALDLLGWSEVEATLAGDDTILVVTQTSATAARFCRKLAELAKRRLS
jgi:transcriptional regulator of arginine metabolism